MLDVRDKNFFLSPHSWISVIMILCNLKHSTHCFNLFSEIQTKRAGHPCRACDWTTESASTLPCVSLSDRGVGHYSGCGGPPTRVATGEVLTGAVGPRKWGHGPGRWSESRAQAFPLPVWCGPTLPLLNAVASVDTAKPCGLIILWQVHSCRCISSQVFDRETGGPFAL